MLATEEFAAWSKKVVLFLHVTSRVDDEPYPNLLLEKGANGFPTMSYLDAEGNLLKQVGHITPVAQLETAYQELQAWRALRAEVEAGGADAAKEKELFLLELDMGNRPFAEMQQRRDRLSLSDEERQATEPKLVNLEFQQILRATPRDQMAKGGEQFVRMFRAGRIPAGGSDTSFWQYAFAYAGAQQDVPLFEELLAWVKANRADDARLRRYLPQLEEQLAALKAKKNG